MIIDTPADLLDAAAEVIDTMRHAAKRLRNT
jgi:hypothetical protein